MVLSDGAAMLNEMKDIRENLRSFIMEKNLVDMRQMAMDPSHCFLGLNLSINHVIIFFTVLANRNILSEYCLVVLLVCPGLWWGCLFLLFLSPTLRLIFWLLFNPFAAAFL